MQRIAVFKADVAKFSLLPLRVKDKDPMQVEKPEHRMPPIPLKVALTSPPQPVVLN